jgi:hypothetical protein
VARLFGVALTEKENGEIVVNSSNKLVNATATRIQKLSHDSLNISVATTIAMYTLLAAGIIAVIGIIWVISKALEKEATAAEKAAQAHEEQK